MSKNFLEYWNQAKLYEEKGHKYFQIKEYQKAADNHKNAAALFKKSVEFIDKKDEEIQRKTMGNYYIELANHYYSLATYYFYRGDKQDALVNYQLAIEEQKKIIQEYETLKEKKPYQQEIIFLKVTLHFYLAHENLCLAQIDFLNENYSRAVEYFKTAEIHNNLELEFLLEISDFERYKRSKARLYYLKGQILRSEALIAIQNLNRIEAKEKYLKASLFFEDASKLYPEWKEYMELAKKTKKMASIIRN